MDDNLSRGEVEGVNVKLLTGTSPSSEGPETSYNSAQALTELYILVLLVITSTA